MSDPYRRDWMTDKQYRCYKMIAFSVGGFHHVPSEPKKFCNGIKVSFYSGSLATADLDLLTRIVINAHDWAVRVELMQSGPGRVGLALFARQRDGSVYERHPTILEAVEKHSHSEEWLEDVYKK